MLFDDYEAMDIDDLMEKYGDRIKKEDYNDEIIKNIASTLVDQYNIILNTYEDKIREIYGCITAVKKIDAPRGDIGSILLLAKNIIYLKNDIHFYHSDDEYKKKLCNKAYEYISKESSYSMYFKKDEKIEEDYKSIHLLDLKYHLNNFKKYCTNKDFLDLANNDMWRYF